MEKLQRESHPGGLSLGINGFLTSGLRGTAALPWVPPGLMAGSQRTATTTKSSNSYNREDEGFFLLSMRRPLGERNGQLPETYGCDFSWLAESQKEKAGRGKYSLFCCRWGCPSGEIPPTLLSRPILKAWGSYVTYSGRLVRGERRSACCASRPLPFQQSRPRSVSAQACTNVCSVPGSQGRAPTSACVLSWL